MYAIDLFCGAGGVSEGLLQSGFDILFSSDISKDVEKTYKNRHEQLGWVQGYNTYFHRSDVRDLTGAFILDKINTLTYYNRDFKVGDIDLMFGGPSCFTEDTLVLTKEGYKKITDIKIGDEVLSHDKQYHKVTDFLKQGKRCLYHLKADVFHELHTTKNHKFYVRRKDAKTPIWLSVNELLSLTNNQPTYEDYYVGHAINQESKIPTWEDILGIKSDLDLDDALLWYFVGLYLSNGWLTVKCDDNEMNPTITGISIYQEKQNAEQFETRFNNHFTYTKEELNGTIIYDFTQDELIRLVSLFGAQLTQHKIPGFVFDLPKHLIHALICGYVDYYDVIKSDEKRLSITSISKELVYGFASLFMKAYQKPCKVSKNKNTIVFDDDLETNDYYNVTLDFETTSNAFFEDGYVWYPILDIEELKRDALVYDITVADSHSFLANNCIAHNCQGFSRLQGKRDPNDPRNFLFKEYVRIISEIQPKYVCMENVVGFMDFKFYGFESLDGSIYPDEMTAPQILKEEFEKIGYQTLEPQILNAADYGVPQRRRRVIFMAYRKDCKQPHYPKKTVEMPFTLEDGISDLLTGKVANKYQQESIQGRTPHFKTRMPIKAEVTKNQELPIHNEKTTERFSLYLEGEDTPRLRARVATGIDISSCEELLTLFPPSYGTKEDIITMFKMGTATEEMIRILLTKKNIRRKLSKGLPAPTIVTLPDDYISPYQNRTFTVREMARLQSFDDSFEFLGKRTTGGAKRKVEVPQYTQVGNAVPPLMAKKIADVIKECLEE